MPMINRIEQMLRMAAGDGRLFPATILFNEGWLLRLILSWVASAGRTDLPLSFAAGAKWFSEALIPSQFLPRSRSDPLGEGFTHADGVFGHVTIGSAAFADVRLLPSATQLVVTEAKLF